MQALTPRPLWSWARSHTSHGGIRVKCKVSHLQDPMEDPIPYLSCLYIFDATLIWSRISLFVFEITRPSRWPIRSCCGSKLRATGFKSWSGRMLVNEVVPMQCSKLFQGMECAVMSMALCTIKNSWSYSRVFAILFRDIAMIVQKAT